MKTDRDHLDDIEPFVCDVSDMADVAVVVLNHHRREIQAVAGTEMTAKQAVAALEHTMKLVDFCVYHVNEMAVSLRQQYYAADEVAS